MSRHRLFSAVAQLLAEAAADRGVVLAVDAAGAESLPEPGKSPAAMEVTGEDFVEREWDDELEGKLKRAWDFLSGKRTEDHRG